MSINNIQKIYGSSVESPTSPNKKKPLMLSPIKMLSVERERAVADLQSSPFKIGKNSLSTSMNNTFVLDEET